MTRRASQQHPAEKPGHGKDQSPATSDAESEKQKPFPPPIGPMVAVFLDESSVEKLKAHFPEARDGQLRKVVVQYGPSASERQMYRHLFGGTAEVTVRRRRGLFLYCAEFRLSDSSFLALRWCSLWQRRCPLHHSAILVV